MKIAIIGAGAIGNWIGCALAASGNTISMLARGQSLDTIKTSGLRLITQETDTSYKVHASDNPKDLGKHDLVIIAVKSHHLTDIASAVSELITPSSMVIPMINGVPWWFMDDGKGLKSLDPEGYLSRLIPYQQIIGCVIHASCSSPAPATAHLKFADKIILGDPSGCNSKTAENIQKIFEAAAVKTVISTNIRHDIWYKLWGNMTLNPISALTRSTSLAVLDDDYTRHFMHEIMREAQEIGASIGCPIDQTPAERNQITRTLGDFKTSMLQDLEAGKQLEIEALLTAPKEIAIAQGIATPNLDILLGLIRLLAARHGSSYKS
ncbi:ketopantoate reductase family protein [Kordiimonas pumila]|uniref:2-dehydropantoate 2-reductase n=1 Tax=Kordiimonas pumila TaxID=2161677 RepID=A0ABV7D461_9PROT|nr:2-dehydropantoate 2-reductase [Kordiimonas pumila]